MNIVTSFGSRRHKMTWKLLLGLIGFVLLLSACNNVTVITEKPEISLSVDKNSVQSGGSVTLKVDVTKGKVSSVTFKRDKGGAIPPVTTPDANGDFVTTVAVTEKTVFSAEATGTAGSGTAQSEAVVVDIGTTPQSPVAVSQTFITYAEVPLLYGITPTDFAATSQVKVEGIVGSVQPVTDKPTTAKGKVTINAGQNALAFKYTPPGNQFQGTDTFDYSVTSNGQTAKATITVKVNALGPKVIQVSTLEGSGGVNSQPPAQTIILTKQIFCNQSPCVRLKNSQVLTGSYTTADGVTITSPNAGIDASIPDTRKSGEPPANLVPGATYTETKVIELADDVTISDIKITSSSTNERSSYFTALIGTTNGFSPDTNNPDSGNLISGTINLKNVTIAGSNGKPIYMKYDESATNFGNYNLFIENLTLKDANDTMVIGNAQTLVIKNSTIELLQPVGEPVSGPNPFGDNAGTQIFTTTSSSVTLDNVDVFMESTKYEINLDGEKNNAVPFEIVTKNVNTSLTVKNCDIKFGDILPGADSAAFRVIGSGGTVNINQAESINNTSKEGSSNAPGLNKIGSVNGSIQFN